MTIAEQNTARQKHYQALSESEQSDLLIVSKMPAHLKKLTDDLFKARDLEDDDLYEATAIKIKTDMMRVSGKSDVNISEES